MVHLSANLCIDESFSRWYGLGGIWAFLGLPHYVKFDRKPEAGCEIYTACDERVNLYLLLKSLPVTRKRNIEKSMELGLLLHCELWNESVNQTMVNIELYMTTHILLLWNVLKHCVKILACASKEP